ncbi:MAG: flippase-like domain-containing protein [Chloroflexi bacterium]|nr:flippase-like domain-containing protein [Chloroflexota bacterium]
MKNLLSNLLKIVVTLAIIVFLFSRVDLAAMGRQLARANGALLLLALALYFLAIVVGAAKWQVVARAQNDLRASLGELLTYSLVGLFFGNLLPSNVGGDVIRAYGLARASGKHEAAAISVLVDRLMGLTAFLGSAVVMALIAAVTLTRGELEQIEIATVIAATVLIGGSALLFSRRVGQRVKGIFDHAPFSRVQPIAQRVYHALQVYRNRYDALALNLFLSTCIVLITTTVWYTVALALGSDVPLLYFFLFNPLIAFVLLIPISFNGLGPKEATAVFFFGLVGMPNEIALAMSLVFHLLIVLTSLPGGVLWWRERALAPSANETPIVRG